jgi:hypothetical protein
MTRPEGAPAAASKRLVAPITRWTAVRLGVVDRAGRFRVDSGSIRGRFRVHSHRRCPERAIVRSGSLSGLGLLARPVASVSFLATHADSAAAEECAGRRAGAAAQMLATDERVDEPHSRPPCPFAPTGSDLLARVGTGLESTASVPGQYAPRPSSRRLRQALACGVGQVTVVPSSGCYAGPAPRPCCCGQRRPSGRRQWPSLDALLTARR